METIAELDAQFAELIAFLKRTGQQAHTTKGQTLIFRPRRARRSRLTGKLR